ncbi:MAG: acetate kinase [Clostridiales bacterium]|jgi:acetate kinase|nr:acetate kinase [Clostridiales bacterium]
MKILVMNCGSSSLKYQLIDMDGEKALAKGLCERIGIDGSNLKHKSAGKDDYALQTPMPDHTAAVRVVMDALLDENHGVIKSIDDINAVGHRVVHGGEYFSASVIVTDDVKKAVDKCGELAPLHNPPNLTGINVCEALMPNIPQAAVFDTAFHQTMPMKAFLYALPYRYYIKHKVRRYGFHGTSHRFVTQKAAELMGRPIEETKLISCHLGNGASICAVDGGKSIDTSMGFTPLEGLVMGTRAGDMDPAVITYIMTKENLSAKEMDVILNKESGMLGVSGVSSDCRDIEAEAAKGNERAKIAIQSFCYRVAKYIGQYAAALNGAEAIIFTAGLGENAVNVRKEICSYLGYLGLEFDEEANKARGKTFEISKPGSKTRAFVIPTNEELVIARDTKELLDRR